MLLAAVVLLTFLMPMSQRSKATQDTSIEETLDRALDYLVNNYNATIGLIPEVPSSTTYYLYSDNFLASYILGYYTQNNLTLTSIATNISSTIWKYIQPLPDSMNQYMVLNSSVAAFNGSSNYIIASYENTVINSTINNGTEILHSFDYADIAFLKALYYSRTDQTQALIEYQIGADMFNGKGINDTAFRNGTQIGEYQTFKLALYIYVSRVLQQQYAQDIRTILLNMQANSGGFYTGYDENFSSNGTNTNVETTCLAILALKEPLIPLIPEFQYQILVSVLVISTALVVFLQKARKILSQDDGQAILSTGQHKEAHT